MRFPHAGGGRQYRQIPKWELIKQQWQTTSIDKNFGVDPEDRTGASRPQATEIEIEMKDFLCKGALEKWDPVLVNF
jgi:hypothetical protein